MKIEAVEIYYAKTSAGFFPMQSFQFVKTEDTLIYCKKSVLRLTLGQLLYREKGEKGNVMAHNGKGSYLCVTSNHAC